MLDQLGIHHGGNRLQHSGGARFIGNSLGQQRQEDRALVGHDRAGVMHDRDQIASLVRDRGAFRKQRGHPVIDLLIEKERESARARVERALADAIDQLPAEDRLVLQLRLYDGISLVDVSRSLGRDVRQIYRRWEAMMRRLRASLEGVGCDARLVCLALGEETSRPAIRRRGPSLEVERSR